jgi:hypothetical protein
MELRKAAETRRRLIVLTSPIFVPSLRSEFGDAVVPMDPADPVGSESSVIEHLKQLGLDTKARSAKALVALGVLALGLVLLSTVNQE